METAAQKFMNKEGISECYECDGLLFKHFDNAEARRKATGENVIIHNLSAGPAQKTEEEETPNN